MLIRQLSEAARKQLSEFHFDEDADINQEKEGGNVIYGFYSFTPLAYACFEGHLDLVKELVESGATLNKGDQFFDYTPIMWAASQGYDSVVSYLLKSGADPRHQSTERKKPETAYSLSKKDSFYHIHGLWQRMHETLDKANFDNTHEILAPYRKR